MSLVDAAATCCLRLVLVLAAALGAASANAHLMFSASGSLSVVGTEARFALTLPVAMFRGVDADGDHAVEALEVELGQEELRRQFREGVTLASGDAMGVWRDIALRLAPVRGGEASAYLVVEAVAEFARSPEELELHSRLWSDSAPLLKVTAAKADLGHESQVEVGILSERSPSYRFFASRLGTFRHFVGLGVEHIFLGYDHLLFLAVLLSTSIGWRRWILLLSTFSLAHGTTFALATLQLVSVPVSAVEALIAASIVLMAMLQLMGRRFTVRYEAALVFGAGLIHGLGFASALRGEGRGTREPLLAIFGFNIGVELGQLVFAGGVFLVALAVSLASHGGSPLRLRQGGLLVASGVGLYWLVERLI